MRLVAPACYLDKLRVSSIRMAGSGSGRLALALLAARLLQKLARLASVGTSNSKLVLLLLDSLSLLYIFNRCLIHKHLILFTIRHYPPVPPAGGLARYPGWFASDSVEDADAFMSHQFCQGEYIRTVSQHGKRKGTPEIVKGGGFHAGFLRSAS